MILLNIYLPFYTKLLYLTEFSIVQQSRFSISQYFVVLDVVLSDTERCSVVFSILFCSVLTYGVEYFLRLKKHVIVGLGTDTNTPCEIT
jgi:hypothetical protein